MWGCILQHLILNTNRKKHGTILDVLEKFGGAVHGGFHLHKESKLQKPFFYC